MPTWSRSIARPTHTGPSTKAHRKNSSLTRTTPRRKLHRLWRRHTPNFTLLDQVTKGVTPGTIERVTCWPMKEVPDNLDTTTGMLGLTDTEENQIVAFLETLSDGFTTPYPNSDTFTGVCMTCNPSTDPNCSPSRQGNGTLIPTPPLPPCASAICGVAPLPGPTPIP